jgi:hypothetical protein
MQITHKERSGGTNVRILEKFGKLDEISFKVRLRIRVAEFIGKDGCKGLNVNELTDSILIMLINERKSDSQKAIFTPKN